MDKLRRATSLMDRTDVILSNVIALTNPDRDFFTVPVIDVIVSIETAVDMLREAQDIYSEAALLKVNAEQNQ